MSNILDNYLADQKAPEGLKEKVMASARLLILAKDLGELFSNGIQETGKNVAKSIDESTSTKTNRSKKNKDQ